MPVSPNTAGSAPVAVIPVHQSIESGLYKFMQRAFREAEEAGAMYIVLDINTLGGRVDTAEEIGELVRGSQIPTVAFVHGKAVSAGSYIALNAGVIMMEPGSSIGSAAVVDGTGREVESAKVVSHWASEMRSAAELRQRDPRIAEAMVDKNVGVSLPGLNRTVQQGELVSLTAEEAYAVGYADRVAKNLQEVKHFLNADHHPELMISPSPAETLARFLVQPYIATLLLVIGIAGVAIELFVPGFGLPGILGLVGFGLYFFGHYIAGFAGGEELALFALGIVLLILELFVSSFGLLGVAGILCLFGSVVMAAYNTASAVISLGIAAAIALVIIIIVVRLFKHRGVWNKFILRDELRTEQGYVSTPSKMGLLGQPGTAITPLRPAGTALFQGQRVDVVTNGEFIPAQTDIYVVGVEGVRVVVARKV
ncbi:nodulation protein NfeD [Paenibacillus thalictri]|uniref:Nodulation protein NfeD n=2 Tax=Paenibacillus thalictri TaxID=2527873 RepID=A0A4Q9DJ51_9BACL|nr:nodulation protein NfeD [Paenibacillus thalictri]